MNRGADPEGVEGVALYGFRKRISADTLSTWANGYKHMTDGKVPGDVAADLVRLSMEKGLADKDFTTLKWSLVDGVKNGFDPKDYASYLFGTLLEGKNGPGRISADAKSVFLKARRAKKKSAFPVHEGVFAKALPPPPLYGPPAVKSVIAEVPVIKEAQKKTTDALGRLGLGIPQMPRVT